MNCKTSRNKSDSYSIDEIKDLIARINNRKKTIYILAIDASGKVYKKSCYKISFLYVLVNNKY